ncbi:hypothetical protein SRHO_G00124480 [Serrasalmus rhombeus]
MRHQGAWTRWENAVERKVTWTEIWKAKPHRNKFLIRAVYDVLPSPSNLQTWGIAETPACPLCSKRVSSLQKTIAFVRAAEQAAPVKRSPAGILTTARDWQLLVDLERQLKFPSHIAVTTLRPDLVLVSESTKQAVLLEQFHGKTAWKKHLIGSSPGTRDWSAAVSRLDGERGASQWRLDAEVSRPVPWPEP